MAPRPNISLNSPSKASKLMALIALVVAFSLPFILVKSFPHKHRIAGGNPPNAIPIVDKTIEGALSSTKNFSRPATISTSIKLPKQVVTKVVPPLPKTSAPAIVAVKVEEVKSEWKTIKTRNRETIANVFKRAGLDDKTVNTVLKDTPKNTISSKLRANQDIRLKVKNHSLEKMIIPFSMTQYLVIYQQGEHYKNRIKTRKMEARNLYVTATIQGSLYVTAKRKNIPYKFIQQMTEILQWDIDFSKEVRAGDQFTLIYKAFYIKNKMVNTGDVLAVSYRKRGNTFQAVRHTNRAGRSEYYTPLGRSLKKAFTRYPLHFSHISSAFSLARYHPILHYRRAHKGVDLAARIGTPIQATGDGRIEIIGRQNAYGNMIKIKHNNTYSTIYGHMLKFQKGLSRGSSVKRGQIIGFVGQTGLASGPHCHYEFHINNIPRNPSTMDLPRGDSISGRELARFKAVTTSLLAELKRHEQTNFAEATKKAKGRG